MKQFEKISKVTDEYVQPERLPLLDEPETSAEQENRKEKNKFEKLMMSLIPKKQNTKPKPFPWKSISAKNALIVSCVALIAVAGYINIRYFLGDTPSDVPPVDTGASAETGEQLPSDPAAEDENYFTVAVINRQRVRDEAIDLLQTLMESDSTPTDRREEILVEMNRIADEITCEVNIENLIRAKGIDECVAVINGENANIIVKSAGLTPAEIAQIKEIVYLQTGITPKSIKIMEKAI